jgi:RNA polymerase sigma-70 factor, ECF subfamily
MDISEEKELVRRARQEPEAFGVIFDLYHDAIFGYVLKRVGNVPASQDITAETFFKAMDRLWQFRWKNISISSWLYRIATNEVNQYFRKNKNRHRSLDTLMEEEGFEPRDDADLFEEILEQERELARADEWREVRRHIEELPEKYQEVLVLKYFENKKIAEVAEILGKKEGTVKSLLSRAIARLKEKCNQKDPLALYKARRSG